MSTTEIILGKTFSKLDNIIKNSKYNNIVEFSEHFIVYFADLNRIIKYKINKHILTKSQFIQLSNNVRKQVHDKISN